MQGVLCLAFGASLALAEWVVHHGNVTRLAKVEFLGPIGICRPQGWMLQSETEHPIVKFVAVEPRLKGLPSRTLIVQQKQMPPGTTPEVFLSSMGLYWGASAIPIDIGGITGVLLSNRPAEVSDPAAVEDAVDNQFIAGCVGPTGIAISIQLKCPREPVLQVDEDRQLIQDIARHIILQADPTGE